MDLHDQYDQHDLTTSTRSARSGKKGRRRFDDDEPGPVRGRRPVPVLEGPDPDGPAERAEDVQYSTWLGAVHGPTPRPDWVVTDLGAIDTELGIL